MPTKPKAAAKKAASPTRKPNVSRSSEIEIEILERMSTGEPLAVILRSDPTKFPTTAAWAEWCRNDADLGIRHARARDDGYDAIARDCMAIADANIDDVYCAADGEERTNSDVIQRAKLRVETRLKLLAKWDPKRYGDKLDVNATVSGDIRIVIGGAEKES